MQKFNQSMYNYKKGITLLEVLLYIGLFTILSISIIFLYISISKSASLIKDNIQKSEIAFFVYELARYKLDTYGYVIPPDLNATSSSQNLSSQNIIKTEDFSRILKYYPNIKMTEITMDLINALETTGKNNYTNITYKISYKLAYKKVNNLSEKIFLNTLYIDSL